MRNLFFVLIALSIVLPLYAQPTVAPTSEPAGAAKGEDWSGFNIRESVETGYRARTVGGNIQKYRSDVNFGNGIRLLSSSFTMNSKNGKGRYFDEIVITTQGLGSDPYRSAALRVQKNGLYRYDMIWRGVDYSNPGLTTGDAGGQHLLNTSYGLQDHDLTLFPQSKFRFFLGYTRGSQTGAALSSALLFDSRGNQFPLFADVRRRRNEYRVGNESRLLGIRFNWMHGWEDFKEDTSYQSSLETSGLAPANATALSSFARAEPYHGTSPYWRASLFGERKTFSVNGRFTYTSGQRAFALNELSAGADRFGAAANQQIFTAGNARRPVATGNLTLSFSPLKDFIVTNHTSVYNLRTLGDSTFIQYDNASLDGTVLYYQYLGIRTFANESDVNFQAKPWLGIYAGYHYSNRRIQSVEQTGVPDSAPDAIRVDQTNQQHSGIAGLRLRPSKSLTFTLDAEIGRADQPFTPVADRNFHNLGARVRYKRKTVQFSAYTRANYNTNSVSLSSYSSHARTYAADGSWAPRPWLSLDASYSNLHLNTVGGIAYFQIFRLVRGEQSYYFSNIHAGNLGVRIAPHKRADLYVGYSHIQDTGDGRSTPGGSGLGSTSALFEAAQTFPLTFQSPIGRLSVSLTRKVRWNVGYQHYGYHEQFYDTRNYRAHTGYTSLLWSF